MPDYLINATKREYVRISYGTPLRFYMRQLDYRWKIGEDMIYILFSREAPDLNDVSKLINLYE